MTLVDITPHERRLAEHVDQEITGELAISNKVGGLAFVSMAQVMEFAKLMALSSVAVPKHLRGNPGACLGVCIQALEWGMSPYAVANKSYSVNDRLSYEAQLVEAVILRRAPIKGRPKVEYKGQGAQRVCRVYAELKDEPGEIVEYESPAFATITPKNSPLWKADPDQQHFYYSVRAWCRRHFPDVLLGVYAWDELPEEQRPTAAVGIVKTKADLQSRLDRLAAPQQEFSSSGVLIEQNAEPQTATVKGREFDATGDDDEDFRGAVIADAEANDGAPTQLDRRGETVLAMLNGQAEQCQTLDDLVEVQQGAQKLLDKASPATKAEANKLFKRHSERFVSDVGEA